MKEAPLRQAAALLPWREHNVWLGQRGNSRFLPGYWVFPGGGCDQGETHQQAALRELQEETGLALPSQTALRPLDRAITPAYSLVRYDCLVYAAELPPELEPIADGVELEKGRWFDCQELLDMWSRGEVQLAPPTVRQVRLFRDCFEGRRAWPQEDEAFALPAQDFEWLLPVTEGLDLIPLKSCALPPASWTNSALLGTDSFLVVDPGGPDPGLLRDEVERRTSNGQDCLGVLLTHQHPDHLEGYLPLGMTELPLFCHPLTVPLLPGDFPTPTTIEDGHLFELGTITVRCHFTPGHAPGHLALELVEKRALFAADLISSLSSIVLPLSNGDLGHYMESLRRMQALECSLVVPSHGPPFGKGSDPFGKALAHRQQRENQVLEALSATEGLSVEEITKRVYEGLKPALVPAAQGNVRHHLKKLRKGGRVRNTGSEGWTRS